MCTLAVTVTVPLPLCAEARDPSAAAALVIASILPGRVLSIAITWANCCCHCCCSCCCRGGGDGSGSCGSSSGGCDCSSFIKADTISTTTFEAGIPNTIGIAFIFPLFVGATGLIIKAKTLLRINSIEGITLLAAILIASSIKNRINEIDERNMDY